MKLQKIKESHAKQISILIKKTFGEFNADTFTPSARTDFLNEITEQNIKKYLKDLTGYVVIIDSSVVGVIMTSNKRKKITALFVDKKHHHKGIATKLVKTVENDFKKTGAKSIRCWSSIYAAPFYEKQGFKKTRGIVKTKKGYIYQPMKKIF